MKAKKGPGLLWWALAVAALAAALGYYFFNLPQPPSVTVYFLKGEELQAVVRPLGEGEDPAKAAARELMRGPNFKETNSGIFSEIPRKAKVLKISKENGILAVDFNRELARYGGGSARAQGLIAQIVYTFTEIPGVSKVRILVAGKGEVVLGGEGLVIDKPLSREDVKF